MSIWLAGLNQVVQDVKWLLQSFVLLSWSAASAQCAKIGKKGQKVSLNPDVLIFEYKLVDGVYYKIKRF